MAKKFILAQAREVEGQRRTIHIRGVFSQKKKLEEALKALGLDVGTTLYDDVNDRSRDMKYSHLCNILTSNGRVVLVNGEGSRVAIIVAASENDIRPWDVDELGKAIANPLAASKDDEPEPTE
jgi:hypothetical protein